MAVIPGVVEHLFRHESGRVLATVMRFVNNLDLAEEIVQESLVAALEHWPFSGVPDNPGAWLMTTAKNRAYDHLRRERRIAEKLDDVAFSVASQQDAMPTDLADQGGQPPTIGDDRLRLIFMCCHPELSREGQVAITLRLIGGLSTDEIARAFLVAEPTIAQRIVRAKRTIRDRQIPYAAPEAAELPVRLSPVLEVIYLIFNEGYTARQGAELIRRELCSEAVRLGSILALLLPDAEVLGLCALMELQASRSQARTDAEGNLVLLADQERSRWDTAQIDRGLGHLAAARAGAARAGPYQLQAAIAACHSEAKTWEGTDWRRIAALYRELTVVAPSPIIDLNHAVAVSMVDGPGAALALLDSCQELAALSDYHLLAATRADFHRRLGQWEAAASSYRRAIALTQNLPEREFLERRLEECLRGLRH